jgi:hypothetical protein
MVEKDVRRWELLSVYGPTDGEATVVGPTVLPPEPVEVFSGSDLHDRLDELEAEIGGGLSSTPVGAVGAAFATISRVRALLPERSDR